MNAYVINLDKRKDRWKQMKIDWKDYDIKLIRVSAIEDIVGKVGCAKSHLKIIKYAKKKKLPYVLVLEDDAIPTTNFKELWNNCLEFNETHNGKFDLFNGGPTVAFKKYTKKLTNIFYKTDSLWGAHFILYNEKCYDKVLSWENLLEQEEDRPPIDVFISYPYLTLKMFGVCPFIAVQRPDMSNIENKFMDYTEKSKRSEKLIKNILLSS